MDVDPHAHFILGIQTIQVVTWKKGDEVLHARHPKTKLLFKYCMFLILHVSYFFYMWSCLCYCRSRVCVCCVREMGKTDSARQALPVWSVMLMHQATSVICSCRRCRHLEGVFALARDFDCICLVPHESTSQSAPHTAAAINQRKHWQLDVIIALHQSRAADGL